MTLDTQKLIKSTERKVTKDQNNEIIPDLRKISLFVFTVRLENKAIRE